MEKLFVYGTLQDPEVQKKVFGRVAEGIPATLDGYEKSTIVSEGNTYPIAIRKPNNYIKGSILTVSLEELKKIDEYESTDYRRIKVVLKNGKSAWAYVK